MIRSRAILVILKLIAFLSLFSCNNINSKLESISDYYDIEQYGKVIELSTELITKYDNEEARKYRGKTYHKIGRYQKAFIDYYYLYTIIGDSSSEVLEGLGFAHLKLGEFQKSFSFYESLILRDSQNPNYYFNSAANLFYVSQFKDAIVYVDKALLLDSTNADYLNLKATAYSELLDYNEAINCFNLFIQYHPNNEVIYFNRGMMHFLKENYNAAILDFNKSIEMNNKKADFYYYRGLAYSKLENRILACNDLERCKTLNKLDIDQTFLNYCKE